MKPGTLRHTFSRYRTLATDRVGVLPIVILMPHSACNCRCIMCDIWKDNKNLKQLAARDVEKILVSLKKLDTRQVVLSGGEALLHASFFELCSMIKKEGLDIILLSTGLGLERHARQITELVDEVIVSLDGDPATHDHIRNISGAFEKLRSGIKAIREIDPLFPLKGRSVIHRLNYQVWPEIIETAKAIELDSISFLPADVSSHAFNREMSWSPERQAEVALRREDLQLMDSILNNIISSYKKEFSEGFIAESPARLRQIYDHYAALYGLSGFPVKKCNAPWVSAVIEADGSVRPCFFHEVQGNVHDASLDQIINAPGAVQFRKQLKKQLHDTCRRCVCYLNLPPSVNPVNSRHA